MGLLSFFRHRTSGADAPSGPAESADTLAAARTRARRRLMGAAVLVMVGVIGFPLVFETQPRPVPVDIPIEIPRKEGAPALTMPPVRTQAAKASSAIESSPGEEAPAPVAVERPRESARPASAAAPKVAAPPAVEPAKKAVAEARPAAPAPVPDAARAKALLEGKEAAKPAAVAAKAEAARDAGRFVVQVGAFADAAAAREMRTRVEKLGLKSYTQVVETSSGSRTRVRAGPYESRDEAERALAKARAAGLNAVVLTL